MRSETWHSILLVENVQTSTLPWFHCHLCMLKYQTCIVYRIFSVLREKSDQEIASLELTPHFEWNRPLTLASVCCTRFCITQLSRALQWLMQCIVQRRRELHNSCKSFNALDIVFIDVSPLVLSTKNQQGSTNVVLLFVFWAVSSQLSRLNHLSRQNRVIP